jgi:tRNA A37 threonylcarbamoyladenosine dehydratase
MLIGKKGIAKLKNSAVAVFGLGGVGAYAAEALVRSGIGALALFDDDIICLTNINRQLTATSKTVGLPKVEVMKKRALEINPEIKVQAFQIFYGPATADAVDLREYAYIADAIDTVSSKLLLAQSAYQANIPIISCMGAGNKLNPALFKTGDIFETSICPLARIMRRELRKRGVKSLKVVYSAEEPLKPQLAEYADCRKNCVCPPGTARKCFNRRQVPGSAVFAPAAAGIILAGEIVQDLLKNL